MSDRVPCFVLAGGQSSRFGSDKARALVKGRPLLVHVARALVAHASRITVVAARADAYHDLGLRTIADRIPGLGPLGGLHTALADLGRAPWLLLCSCDWLGITPAWIEELLRHRRPGTRAVAFRGRRWEPLLALYHRELLAEAAGSLAAGERALWRLIERAAHVALPLPPDWSRAAQINWRHQLEDLAREQSVR